MKKLILTIATVAMMIGIAQPVCAQDVPKTQIEAEQQAVVITVNESTVHVKNAAGLILEVYNIAGVKVCTLKIDGNDKAIDLNNMQKGCYILKVGKTVRKVYLK